MSTRYDLPLLPDGDHDLDRDEIRVLWSFIHGDIMDGQMRQRLREHWGMCTRHAWGYAVTEIELWQSGAGKRGGHQPFDVAILYTDLLETMTFQLSKHHRRARRRILEGHGSCVICDDVRGPELTGIVVNYAGFDSDTLATEANRMSFTRDWLAKTQPRWEKEACPDCIDRMNVDGDSRAQRCRLHLVIADQFDDETIRATTTVLTDLRMRLVLLTDSMTQHGEPSTPEADASWIATLGWFHGWDFPRDLGI